MKDGAFIKEFMITFAEGTLIGTGIVTVFMLGVKTATKACDKGFQIWQREGFLKFFNGDKELSWEEACEYAKTLRK